MEKAKTKAQAIARTLGGYAGQGDRSDEGGVHILPREEAFAATDAFRCRCISNGPLEPGEVRVRASVTIRYEISPP